MNLCEYEFMYDSSRYMYFVQEVTILTAAWMCTKTRLAGA